MTRRELDAGTWWLQHVLAAILGFVTGGYVIARVWRYGSESEWWFFGALLSALACLVLSVLFPDGFWSGVLRIFGKR